MCATASSSRYCACVCALSYHRMFAQRGQCRGPLPFAAILLSSAPLFRPFSEPFPRPPSSLAISGNSYPLLSSLSPSGCQGGELFLAGLGALPCGLHAPLPAPHGRKTGELRQVAGVLGDMCSVCVILLLHLRAPVFSFLFSFSYFSPLSLERRLHAPYTCRGIHVLLVHMYSTELGCVLDRDTGPSQSGSSIYPVSASARVRRRRTSVLGASPGTDTSALSVWGAGHQAGEHMPRTPPPSVMGVTG